ncbi:DUF4383 domain-containing protein [Micromonospora sp. NBRC 107566]
MTSRAEHRPLVSTLALAASSILLLFGILGFIPGITHNYGDLYFAGHTSTAKLFGLFQVSILLNAIHLLSGLIGLAMFRTAASARTFLIGVGIFYAALWIYGIAVNQASSANVIPVNTADNWLHFALAVGMIGSGLTSSRPTRDVTRQAA